MLLATVLLSNIPNNVHGPSTDQPSTFYFHQQSTKTINTVTTSLWANTTQNWSSVAQVEQRIAVDASPAIWDFYTQPILAGDVALTGDVTMTVYLSASSNTGGGTALNATIAKVPSTSSPVQLATGSLPAQIRTTIAAYSLTFPSNTYQLEAGSILDFKITVSITGITPITISLYYDVPLFSSQATPTFQSRIGVGLLATYNVEGARTGSFDRNETVSNRKITFKTTLFDALGIYDIASVKVNVTSPTGIPILTNAPLTLISGTEQSYTGTWSLNLTYSGNDESGSYASSFSIIDNSGTTVAQQLFYILFATWRLEFQTVTRDPTPVPVPEAEVAIFMGGTPLYFGLSNSTGWAVPGGILLSDNNTYTIYLYWQGTLADQVPSYHPVVSQRRTLSLPLYQVDFSKTFKDGSGNRLPQPPSSFQLSYPDGSTSKVDPTTTYLLPQGIYTITGVTWKGGDVTPAIATFNPKDGAPSFNLRVYDLGLLVVDQNGQPVPQAQITLFLNGQMVSQALTGDDGIVEFHTLPGGQYVAVIQANTQSQISRASISLTMNSASKVQVFVTAPHASSLLGSSSFAWIVLVGVLSAASITGTLLYRRRQKSRLMRKGSELERQSSRETGSQQAQVEGKQSLRWQGLS